MASGFHVKRGSGRIVVGIRLFDCLSVLSRPAHGKVQAT